MVFLRILRNLAVLVILTVAGLALTSRPAAAQSFCGCIFFRYQRCSTHTTGCHFCGGSTRCCYTTCYDTLYHRCCSN